MSSFFKKSTLRRISLALALSVSAVGLTALNSQRLSKLISHGPIQQGHVEIDCSRCHLRASGTTRQQVQANLHFILGKRDNQVDFGYQAVTSKQCLDCHQRPNDRHPIYRFNEPRFSQARTELNAHTCLGCHTEHQNQRVSRTSDFCSNCHEELKLKNDPLDIPHEELIQKMSWNTCVGCHDFHGNHTHKPQLFLSQAFKSAETQRYFENGPNPYGSVKIHKAIYDD